MRGLGEIFNPNGPVGPTALPAIKRPVLLYRPEELDEIAVIGEAVAENVNVRKLTVLSVFCGTEGNTKQQHKYEREKTIPPFHKTSFLIVAMLPGAFEYHAASPWINRQRIYSVLTVS
jgi:hypothetical protein